MNKKLLPFLFLATLFTVSLFSCKKADEDEPVTENADAYFPLEKNKYIIYNVDSTIWDDQLCVKISNKYQIMYTVADTFTDGQGRLSYRIDTRIRKKTEDPWTTQDVIYVTNTKAQTELVQKNLRFIKLVYPIQEGRNWEGNALISSIDTPYMYFAGWQYRYDNVGDDFNTGEIIYNNTITVRQVDITENDPETIPNKPALRTYGKEVYAKGLGMVYREYYHWTYDETALANNDPNNPNRCRKGTGVVMKAVTHN